MELHMTAADSLVLPRDRAPAGGLLRAALKLDALVTGANAVAYLALAGPLADLLGVPAGALRAIGAFLAVFAAGVWVVAARPNPPAVRAIVAANVAWAAASLVAVAAEAWSPTTAGAVWIALQAVTVALFAALQVAGYLEASRLRRSSSASVGSSNPINPVSTPPARR
jgi:hypothetical protein